MSSAIYLRSYDAFQKTLWFNIGSIDSLERNLENIQSDLHIEPSKHIPVMYRDEFELASLSNFLPTLLVIGFLVFMMRKSASMMMGGKGQGGGLFGTVMSSTAKLINPNEIEVRFK